MSATDQPRHPAVFLDRDGTIIHDVGYAKDPEQVRLLPGAATALGQLRHSGLRLVLVSNQSGIGRGFITAEEAEAVHRRVLALLADIGIALDGTYYCPHAPEEKCRCRKPSPALLLEAAQALSLDLVRSFMVGDKLSDVQAGKRAGCQTILLATHPVPSDDADRPDAVASSWPQIVRFIQDRTE
jgi:D-glycero-D-manno-heptose 1,7-bisphosphate phosphatase